MKAEEIDKAAEKYFESVICENCRESRLDAFRAGVRLCQPEIAELVKLLKNMYSYYDLTEDMRGWYKVYEALKKYENG